MDKFKVTRNQEFFIDGELSKAASKQQSKNYLLTLEKAQSKSQLAHYEDDIRLREKDMQVRVSNLKVKQKKQRVPVPIRNHSSMN